MPTSLDILCILLAAGTSQGADDVRPLRLHVEREGNATIVQVVGTAAAPVSASYDLQVTSGGNRSVQRGVAKLQPGVRTTVATLRLNAERPARARLTVSSPVVAEYHEEVGW